MKATLLKMFSLAVLVAAFASTVWEIHAQMRPAPCSEPPSAAVNAHPAPQSYIRCDCGKFKTELHSPVTFPDDPMQLVITGAWEGDDPVLNDGTQIGILLKSEAIVKVRLTSGVIMRGFAARSRIAPEFCFYQRTSGQEQRVWFEVGQVLRGMSSSLEGQRLKAEFKNDGPGGNFKHTNIALDLTFDEKQLAWTGNFTRNGITKPLRLERPAPSPGVKASALVGTWALPVSETVDGNLRSYCLSIAQGKDGGFTVWEPSIGYQWIGVDGPPPPVATFEEYTGRRWGITVDGETVTLDSTTYMSGLPGGIPAGPFVGKLSMCGRQIVGRIVRGPLQTWTKQTHGCVELVSVGPGMAETSAY